MKKEDPETQVATDSCKLEAAVVKSIVLAGDFTGLRADLVDPSQQLNMNTMRIDERKTFTNVFETSGDKSFQ